MEAQWNILMRSKQISIFVAFTWICFCVLESYVIWKIYVRALSWVSTYMDWPELDFCFPFFWSCLDLCDFQPKKNIFDCLLRQWKFILIVYCNYPIRSIPWKWKPSFRSPETLHCTRISTRNETFLQIAFLVPTRISFNGLV